MGNSKKYVIEYTPTAILHLKKHQKSGDKAVLKKIAKLISELEEHPYTGTGQPEQLKYDMQGFWSRRINHKDRLIYQVNENIVIVEVLSAMGHYLDK
ncbi:MAG: Txe/YoeB family addiction module toxin [Bacteroidetes bacterium]|nr:Txe/YoeB family addiction module toxin [Bacteroidota bacterium]